MVFIDRLLKHSVCRLNTTNACLFCLSSRLSTYCSMKLLLDYTREQEELSGSLYPSRVDQTLFQVWAALWLQKTHTDCSRYQKGQEKEKKLLVHQAAGGNIDPGSDLLWFCSQVHPQPQFPLICPIMPRCLQLLFSDAASPLTLLSLLTFPASPPHPPLLSLLSSLISRG